MIDPRTRRVTRDDDELALTRKEFDVLALLASDPGATFTREQILETVWDAHWYGPTKTLDVHVAALRRKLGDPALVETVRGVGFRPAHRAPPVTRRLVTTYLALTLLILLALEVPLAVTYQDRQRKELAAAIERDAFVISSYVEDILNGTAPNEDLASIAASYSDRTGGRVVIVDADRDGAHRLRPHHRRAALVRQPARDRRRPRPADRHGHPALRHPRHGPALRGRAGRVGRQGVRRGAHHLLHPPARRRGCVATGCCSRAWRWSRWPPPAPWACCSPVG